MLIRRSAIVTTRACAFAVVASIFSSVGPTIAEVGVADSPPPAPAMAPYILGIIQDGPVPIGTVWRQFNPVGSSGRIILNPQGEANGDGLPSILSNPATSLVVVAWSRNSASGFDVVISRIENGAWSVPQVVVGAPGVDELDPQLVLAPDGTVHLFYWVDGATPQVFYTSAPADLSSWSAPLLASEPGKAACRPSGVFRDGVLRVVYEVHDFGYGNSPRQIVLARYENGAFVPEIVALTNNLGEVRPQVHAHSGKMWVDWIDAETTGGSGEVAWTGVDAQGQWQPIQYVPFVNREERDYLVRGGVRMQAIQ